MTSIGIALFTVRGSLADNFDATLCEIANIGFSGVEFAWNYGGYEPHRLAALLEKINLRCCGIHAPSLEALCNPHDEIYDYAKQLKTPSISISCASNVADSWDETIDKLLVALDVCTGKGTHLSYHNHDAEFIPNKKTAFERLAEATENTDFLFEPDTYWIARAGGDPINILRKYAGRIKQVHIKDGMPNGKFSPLGDGTVGIENIVEVATGTGCQWLIYEQDVCLNHPFEDAKKSFCYLQKILS